MATSPEIDAQLRLRVAERVRSLSAGATLRFQDLTNGIDVGGERMPLVSTARGIFKPRQMRWVLSISTVFPRDRGRVWYDDQREVHAQIEAGETVIDYSFQGTDPKAFDNQLLKAAMEDQVPIFYFLGVAPARYTAIWPTYVVDWNPRILKAGIAFGAPLERDTSAAIPDNAERRYALRLVRQRLHQATFREAVLTAYGSRCTISNLPETRLLDAAHIVPDVQEALGQPVVPNGLPLSKLHHAAFDANLIGIDPDYRIHVSPQLFAMHDGPILEQGIKAKAGQLIALPKRPLDWPDRDRLAQRYELFRAAN